MIKVAYWLFVICFPLLLLTSTIRLAVGNTHIYEYGFDKYEVSEVTGIDRAQLSTIAKRLTDYFKSKAATPQMIVVNRYGKEFELFHDYELIHLEDVKRWFQIDFLLQEVAIGYIAVYVPLFLLWKRSKWQNLLKGITRGSAFILIAAAIVGITSLLINFDQAFVDFHYLVFGNPSSSFWMLDPSKDYLIMLFPEGFWQDVALFLGIAIVGEGVLFGGLAWAIPFVHQRRKRQHRNEVSTA